MLLTSVVEPEVGRVVTQQDGAPLWLMILLPVITAVVTHLFTLFRERRRADAEWHSTWIREAKTLLTKISDQAISHYVNSDAIARSPASAALILSDIKRLGVLIRESRCVDPTDAKVTADALALLNTAVTGPDDFQNINRTPLAATDPVCAEIMSCEHSLLNALNKKRKRRSE